MFSKAIGILLCGLLLAVFTVKAQDDWPRTITAADGSIIRIFHPQPDSFSGDNLLFRAAFSLIKKDTRQPIYGSFRAWALIATDRNNRTLDLQAANVLSLRFAKEADSDSQTQVHRDTDPDTSLREIIACGLPSIGKDLSIDRLITLFDVAPAPRDPSTGLNQIPPRILFANRPSLLIFIDGIPRLKWSRDYALPAVANTPYTILESSDNWWYCYGGHHWYIAPQPEGPWQHTTYIAPDLHHIEASINGINGRESEHLDTIREGNAAVTTLLFATAPSELICTNGDPLFTAIERTCLRYATNADHPLFLDTTTRQYYLLIAGRWFGAPSLAGPWKWLSPNSLPPDFANIPEGSPADRALASVPGTAAAREAVIDAGIPQTATIDRHTATTAVAWDGRPEFIPIAGTRLYYGRNTSSVVIRAKKHFYCLDKGVWFTSQSTTGPWLAATDRPEDIENIPSDCPIYNCKYVYIYGFDNHSVFTGYTAGYLQSYVDGNTLFYGTGYHYPAYEGNAVYPRPSTYGFNIQYNPWFGWSLGYEYSPDWFNTATSWGIGDGNSGWFGPKDFRPPYIWHHYSSHGFYTKDFQLVSPTSYNNNLYTLRGDLRLTPTPELLVTDSAGNVYCADGRGGWLLRKADAWQPVATPFLNRLRDQLIRGEIRVRNFRQAGSPMVPPSPQPLQYEKAANIR
jgi:hypothetical protein